MTRLAPCLALALLFPATLPAQEVQPPPRTAPETPDSAREEALRRLEEDAKRALELFSGQVQGLIEDFSRGLEKIPRYGAPQILPNGDILIPRLDPPAPDAIPDSPAPRPENDPGGETITL